MDLTKIKRAYFIGLKGVGMTMLAQYLHGQGINISGSDVAEDFSTTAETLRRIEATIFTDFKIGRLAGYDLIVYSSAYTPEKNVEVAEALTSKTKTLSYGEALGEVFNQHYGIAVCGSHGKTTTTAWLGYVLWASGLEPSVMVGSRVPQFSGAALVGKSDFLVIEADEYQNKLQYFAPKAIVLNNIDFDHPDFFSDEAAYAQVFVDFVGKLSAKGWLVANFDDEQVRKISESCKGKVISYAIDAEADLRASQLKIEQGRQYFKVSLNDEDLGDFSCQLLGKHNVSNALAVIAAGIELGVSLVNLRTHLGNFTGTARRLEKAGTYNGALIFDDYAHHPTEIKASLAAVRQAYPDKKIMVVFQAHTFSRTRAFFNDFLNSFDLADEVLLLPIWGSAREQETEGENLAQDLVEKMRLLNEEKSVSYVDNLEEATTYLHDNLHEDEVVVLMGATDVFRIRESLLKK